jgi:hypothetical protein
LPIRAEGWFSRVGSANLIQLRRLAAIAKDFGLRGHGRM